MCHYQTCKCASHFRQTYLFRISGDVRYWAGYIFVKPGNLMTTYGEEHRIHTQEERHVIPKDQDVVRLWAFVCPSGKCKERPTGRSGVVKGAQRSMCRSTRGPAAVYIISPLGCGPTPSVAIHGRNGCTIGLKVQDVLAVGRRLGFRWTHTCHTLTFFPGVLGPVGQYEGTQHLPGCPSGQAEGTHKGTGPSSGGRSNAAPYVCL